MNPLLQLPEHGQSYWLDDLSREMIRTGDLAARVTEEGLGGVTSNPSIFAKALQRGNGYRAEIAERAVHGETPQLIYEDLVTADVRNACDVLRPVYDRTQGLDGFASLEVSPHLAHDTPGSIEEARRLWSRVDRPNLFIKIPGTPEGLPAIEELLFAGVNINITLLFSIERYEAVAEAYLRALERRLAAGKPLERVTSVASFFLSRIDVLVDELLAQRIMPVEENTRPGTEHGGPRNGRGRGKERGSAGGPFAQQAKPPTQPQPGGLLGKVAIANAKLAYRKFREILASRRWRALADRGARVQRVLWASTSTKNPAYPDLMYVEPLIGPHTINTMPQETIAAFRDHGHVRDDTVEQDLAGAEWVMRDLERLGISIDLVTDQLENEGVQKFIQAFDAFTEQLTRQRESALSGTKGAPGDVRDHH